MGIRAGNGYDVPDADRLGPIIDRIKQIEQDLKDLQRPTGTSIGSLVEQVQAALANITTTVTNAIAQQSYTRQQIIDRIAEPSTGVAADGPVSGTTLASQYQLTVGTNVTAGGDGSFAGNGSFGAALTVTGNGRVNGTLEAGGILKADAGMTSIDVRNHIVGSSYAGVWVNGDGRLGISPSSRRYKKNITTWTKDPTPLLQLRAVMFRYTEQETSDPRQIGFIAEELEGLGFSEFIFYDEDGEVQGLNYDRMTVALLMLAQHQEDRLSALEERVNNMVM